MSLIYLWNGEDKRQSEKKALTCKKKKKFREQDNYCPDFATAQSKMTRFSDQAISRL